VVRYHQRPPEKLQVNGPVVLIVHSGKSPNADSILSKKYARPNDGGHRTLAASAVRWSDVSPAAGTLKIGDLVGEMSEGGGTLLGRR